MEIKFKAKVIADDIEQWLLFNLPQMDNGLWGWPIDKDVQHIDEYLTPLLLSTSLNDNTGNEIFEGDIVRGNHVDLFVIEAINGGLQMYNSNYYGQQHNELISEATCDAQTASWLKNSTVIGNIYDNPELLETKKTELSERKDE